MSSMGKVFVSQKKKRYWELCWESVQKFSAGN